MKTIFAVRFDVPGEGVKYIRFDSNLSLLDADIVVFKPDISNMYGYGYEYYQGKPCLSEHASFELKGQLDHWRRELNSALSSGKTVFVFLSTPQDVFVDSGQRQTSGTGRNARTTRIVEPCSNYDCLPANLSFTGRTGQAMRLADRADILSAYWRLFGERSQYRVTLEGKVSRKLVVSKDGTRTFGAMVQWKEMPGTVFFLPDTDFDDEDFTKEKDDELHWTKKALALGNQFVACLVEIDGVIRSSGEVTPTPSWANTRDFDLPKERELKTDLLRIEDSLRTLVNQKTTLQQQIYEEALLKNLLYAKGKALEAAVVKALSLLGFKSQPYREGDSEFDVVFESQEGRLIGEAEGKDSKAVNVDKLRQLEMNIHEDYERDGVDVMAKGVLFGNAFRFLPLTERGDFFTEKCITAAQRSGCALVRTPDLFTVAQYLSGTPDAEFARRCRQAILQTSGDVQFPAVPQKTETDEITTKR